MVPGFIEVELKSGVQVTVNVDHIVAVSPITKGQVGYGNVEPHAITRITLALGEPTPTDLHVVDGYAAVVGDIHRTRLEWAATLRGERQ